MLCELAFKPAYGKVYPIPLVFYGESHQIYHALLLTGHGVLLGVLLQKGTDKQCLFKIDLYDNLCYNNFNRKFNINRRKDVP
jgi:hypothetical protein